MIKASKFVKTVLVSSPLFLSGCSGCIVRHDVYCERQINDGVPVVYSPMPGYHYSTWYGGYVPIIVPIGGYSGNATYITHYHSLPPEQRRTYAAPVTTRQSNTISPNRNTGVTTRTNPTSTTKRGIAGGTGLGSVSS